MAALSPDRWHQIDVLFAQALDRPADERTAFLRHACGNDPALYHEIVALLESADDAEAVLGDSVTQFAAPLLQDLDAHLASPDAGPERLGPYRLLREIGRGGMGRVYLAERADGAFEQQVAVKLVKRGMDTDEILRRFRHERQILASLEHPHIARLYDGGASTDGRPYLVMEHVAGRPIDQYCDDRRLPVDERLRLFEAVCEAVQFAHQNLVVHRDLKPSNILVTERGQVKLLDFGIAKLLSDEADVLTRTGLHVMTPEYAAPEQATGAPVTTATDVYALGVVLYELLVGRRPGEGGPAARQATPERPSTAVMRPPDHTPRGSAPPSPEEIAAVRGTTPERLRRQLRGDLDTMLLKALRPEPARRYATAEALLDDIRRYRSRLPVAARPDTARYRLGMFVRRHRLGLAVAAAFVGLLVVFASIYTVRITQERNVARQERDNAEEVAAFLEELLAASNPYSPERTDTLRLADFLDRGAARISTELQAQPLVQAQMAHVLGRVYLNLTLYEQAEPLLRQALALRRAHYGPAHETVAETLPEIAWLRYWQSDFEESEAAAREALAIRQQGYGEQHPAVAASLSRLGRIVQERGDADEAGRLHRTALAINRALHGDVHPSIANTLNALALLSLETGHADSAVAMQQEVVALERALNGDEHPAVAGALHWLGFYLLAHGDYDAGQQAVREALAIKERVFGPLHPTLNNSLNLLGLLLRKQARYDEAEPVLQQALAISRGADAGDYGQEVMALSALATLYREKGDLGAAERRQREALAVIRAHDGGTVETALSAYRLAGILREQGNFREAESLLLDHKAALQAGFAASNEAHVRRALRELVTLYEAWGKPAEAARYQEMLGGE